MKKELDVIVRMSNQWRRIRIEERMNEETDSSFAKYVERSLRIESKHLNSRRTSSTGPK